jgi:hypothetical protein
MRINQNVQLLYLLRGCCRLKSFKQTCIINLQIDLYLSTLIVMSLKADMYKNIIIEIKFIVINFDKYMRMIDLETS